MRRITSLFLLLMLTCIPMWAQPTSYGEGLITDVSQLYSTCGDESEGTDLGVLLDQNPSTFWHTDWHSKVDAPHWIQINLQQPVSGNLVIWMKRRANNDNGHPNKFQLTCANDEEFTDPQPIGEYAISNPTGGADGESPMIKLSRPVQYLRITVTTKNSANETANFWHAAELQLYNPSEHSLQIQRLQNTLTQYDTYLYDDFNYGTNYGQVTDRETGDLFREKLFALEALTLGIENGTAEVPSDEEIDDIVAELDSIYNKVWDSEILYQLAHKGYYRIIANKDYYEDVETGEIDEDTGQPITERHSGIVKSLYGQLEGYVAWHTLDREDCRDIWYLEQNPDSSITMWNAATEMGFKELGAPITMVENPDTCLKMRFDFAGRDEDNNRDIIYIRNNETPRDVVTRYAQGTQSIYLHQQGHGQGAGKGSTMCLWLGTYYRTDNDKGTSEWYLEEVPDEEAQALIEAYAPFKDHDKIVLQYQEKLAEAHTALSTSKSAPTGIIRSTSQFSSKVTESAEGSLNNLLDGKSDTFWHSTWKVQWQGGNWPMGTHFLDVKFDEPISGDYSIWMHRRGNGNSDDNPTKWSIYGSNDETSLEKVGDYENVTVAEELIAQTTDGWTLIQADVLTPWEANQTEVTSDAFNIAEPYQYLRFVCTETKGPNYTDRGYFHIGDFQLNKEGMPTQFGNMGEVATTLQKLVEHGDTVDTELVTYADVVELTAAVDAFKAILVDPAELRKLINDNRATSKLYAQGTEPGYWKSDAEATAMDAILAAADAYDVAAVYTQEQTDKYVTDLTAAVDAFKTGFNPVSTDTWYRIKFQDEAVYDANGWTKSNCANDETKNMGALFGQYATIATYVEATDAVPAYVNVTDPEEIRMGASLHFAEKDLVETNEDASLFRFVAVGDTAYMMQNKATGLFINCLAANNNEVTLSADPTLFKLAACGKGGVIMHGYSVGNADRSALHAQNWNHRLVTWADYSMGSNTGLLLETAMPVEETDFSFVRERRPGALNAECWPLALSAEDGTFYEAVGTYTNDEGHWLALNTVEQSRPGVPFLYIYGDMADYVEEEEFTDPVTFKVMYDEIATSADSIGGMVGTYSALNVEPKTTVVLNKGLAGAVDYNFETGTPSTLGVAAHSAYINFGTVNVEPGEYDLTLLIDGEITDGIQNTIAKVAKSGSVYTLDGKLVRQNATINDVKSLGTGTYILNGVKIRVK